MTTGTLQSSETELILPSGNRWETILLILVLLFLVGATGFYTSQYGQKENQQQLLEWQISSFSDLHGVDQAIYNEMLVAAEEINWMVYYLGYWPDMPDFQEALLPPFYEDLSWKNNGSVNWQLKNVIQEGEAQGLTIYHGSGGTAPEQGAYMMVIDHKHAGNSQIIEPSLWWHTDPNAPVPPQSKIPSFILHGWKQIIPYQGIDELNRINGV